MINFLFGITCGIIATCGLVGFIAHRVSKDRKCIMIDLYDHED